MKPEKEVTTNEHSEEHAGVSTGGSNTDKVREMEGPSDNSPLYSNVNIVCNPPAPSAQENLQKQPNQAVLPESGSKDSASKENEGKEKDVYETIYPSQPSRPAPPKPLPYSLSKKLSKKAGGSGGGEKLAEKVKK